MLYISPETCLLFFSLRSSLGTAGKAESYLSEKLLREGRAKCYSDFNVRQASETQAEQFYHLVG